MFSKLKMAATVAAATVKQKVAKARSLPDRMKCPNCTTAVEVPREVFNWTCAQCSSSNDYEAEACTRCNGPVVRREPYYMRCGQCTATIKVPTTQAAAKASELGAAAKRAYKKQTSYTPTFHCSECAVKLHNPNPPPPGWVAPAQPAESQVRGQPVGAPAAAASASAAPAGVYAQPPPRYEDGTAVEGSAEAEPGSVPERLVTEMSCPVCHQMTRVPTLKIYDNAAKSYTTVRRKAKSGVAMVKGKGSIECPQCHEPVPYDKPKRPEEVPEHVPLPPVDLRVTCAKCSTTLAIQYNHPVGPPPEPEAGQGAE